LWGARRAQVLVTTRLSRLAWQNVGFILNKDVEDKRYGAHPQSQLRWLRVGSCKSALPGAVVTLKRPA